MTAGVRRHPDGSLRTLAETQAGLRLLVLYGSRARGDAHERSDWDFAYEAEAGFDPDRLLAALAESTASISSISLAQARF